MGRSAVLKTTLAVCCMMLLVLQPAGVSGCGGGAQVDMVFIMDESGSVRRENFEKMKDFVRDLVDNFDIGSNTVRVGIMKYSSGNSRYFDLNTYFDKNTMKNSIDSMSYNGGGTNTGGALKYCRESMFVSSRGDRANVPNIAIVMTDGRSWSFTDTSNEAANLRNTGATVFSVGIGSGIPMNELNTIASDPDSQHVFAVSGFSALGSIMATFQAQACPPVHGNWGGWGSYGSCTKSCGSGTKTRTRSCNNPAPSNGGNNCGGSSSDSTSCNTHSCDVNGGWGSWGSYGGCSKTCASGTQSKSRSCNNPPKAGNGLDCPGSSSDSRACNTHNCPIHGGWGSWGSYGSCSKSCATGTQTRTRNCDSPTPQYGGNQCANSGSSSQNCNTHPCPIHGAWTSWAYWGTCSTTCELGSWTRSRSCTNPAPAHGGTNCVGATGDTGSCNLRPCPVDSAWSTWQAWGTCSVTCNGIGTRGRTRNCDNPTPLHGGSNCPGQGIESQTCDKSLYLCSPGNGWAVQVYSTTPGTPVNGGWGSWAAWSACTKTCGAGIQLRTRQCNTPVPKFGGDLCPGTPVEKQLCNNIACPGGGGYVQTCPERFFDCKDGNITCVHYLEKCDCSHHCEDGSDEDPEWAGCIADNSVCNNRARHVSPESQLIALVLMVAAFLPQIWTRFFN